MSRILFLSSILLLGIVACEKDTGVSFDFDRDTPQWLKAKIDTMSQKDLYVGATVYRHVWYREVVYFIEIPLSSCAYCDLYDHEGNKITLKSDAELQDYLHNRTSEVIVWHRGFGA